MKEISNKYKRILRTFCIGSKLRGRERLEAIWHYRKEELESGQK